VLARIARRSARLLDADASPVREAGAGRTGTAVEPPLVVPAAAAGGGTSDAGKEKKRRAWFVALPVVLVLGAGTGTVMLLPFGADGRDRAAPPSHSAGRSPGSPLPASSDSPATSQGAGSPTPSGSKAAKGPTSAPRKDGGSGPTRPGTSSGQTGSSGRSSGGTRSSSASGGSSGGSSASPSSGSGSSGGGSSSGGSSAGGSSGGGSTSTGGSGSGRTVPSAFVGGWTYGDGYNVGQPSTITFASSGTVHLSGLPVSNCSYTAKVTSTANSGTRVNIGPAQADGGSSPLCSTLAASYFTVSGSGIRHYTGDGMTSGYYYQRS